MAEEKTKAKGGGSLLSVIVPVLVLTVVAGGGGFVVGKQIVAKAKAAVAGEAASAAAKPAENPVAVRELPPIVANLTAPTGSWVRLQTAIVYDKADTPQIDVMASKIADDSLAFIRTLSLAQLQGAAGLQHLREDLSERAAVRSEGHIKEMMIEMMVIQ